MIPWQPWGGLGSVTWPHRQMLLPKSRCYFLGMGKKRLKKIIRESWICPASFQKKKADARAVLQWEVTLPHCPQPCPKHPPALGGCRHLLLEAVWGSCRTLAGSCLKLWKEKRFLLLLLFLPGQK